MVAEAAHGLDADIGANGGQLFAEEADVDLSLIHISSAAYAEAVAKLARAPATIFLIPALIPLVPGGYVYYMMSALVLNKLSTMRHYGQLTAEWAFGLAAGIGLIAVLHQIASRRLREKH